MVTRRVHKAGKRIRNLWSPACGRRRRKKKNVISEEEELLDDGGATAAVAEAASAKKVIPATSLPTKYSALLAVAKKEGVSLQKTLAKAAAVAIRAHRQQMHLMQRARAAAPSVPELAPQSRDEVAGLRRRRKEREEDEHARRIERRREDQKRRRMIVEEEEKDSRRVRLKEEEKEEEESQ